MCKNKTVLSVYVQINSSILNSINIYNIQSPMFTGLGAGNKIDEPYRYSFKEFLV